MYLAKYVKIKTPFMDKDPEIVVLTKAEEQLVEIPLDTFCLENNFELLKLVEMPAPLNSNTMIQVGIFKETNWTDGLE